MRVAVTGSTGFVGRRLVERLRDEGSAVLPLTRNGAGDTARWDLGASDNDAKALRGVDTLVHAAVFRPSDLRDSSHAARCLSVNAVGSLGLFEAAAAAGVGKIVLLSAGNLYRDTTRPAREDDALFPSTHAPFYLGSKLVEELFAAHVGEAAGLDLVVLRPSSIFGPGMAGGVIPLFASRIRSGARVTVQDGGEYGADLVYVDDVIQAVLAASQPSISGGTFNVGSGERTTILDLARLLCRLVGADETELLHVEPRSSASPRGFAPLDVSRARDVLKLAPTPLEEGLRRYLAWLS